MLLRSTDQKNRLPVSVIVPCYRCTNTISAAIHSIISQTELPCEIILVEDCSSDNGETLALLERIKSELQALVCIKVLALPKNLGPGEARNAGWFVAEQEFVAFLDADDTWHPKKLEIQVSWMLEHPDFDLTCHDTQVCSRQDQLCSPLGVMQIRQLDWIFLLFRNEIATRSVVLRRDIVHRFQMGIRRAEDYQLWLRILIDGSRAARIRLPLAYSYKHEYGESGLSADLYAMHMGVLRCIKELEEEGIIPQPLHFIATWFEKLKYMLRLIVRAVRVHQLNTRL